MCEKREKEEDHVEEASGENAAGCGVE